MQRLLFIAAAAALLSAQVSDRARKLHQEAFVFDGHVHAIDREFYHGGDFTERKADGQWDLSRAREGGVDALFFSCYVSDEYYPGRFETKHALQEIDVALTQIAKHKDEIELALNGADIDRIHKAGKIAAVLDLEGSFDLDGDLHVLRDLYRLGLRSAQLSAHNTTSNFADSCCSPAKWHGLNDKGRAVIKEMNRLGMVINVSHSSDETMSQAIDLSTAPVVATHHGLRDVNDIPRNIPDWLLKKLAAKGGVMGFQIGSDFHKRAAFDYRTQHAGKAFWDVSDIQKRGATMTIDEIDSKVGGSFPMLGFAMPDTVRITPDEWVAVVDKAVQLVGEDHVALGTDFDGGPSLPVGMRDVRDLSLITDAMLRRGYSEERIRKFLGGNLLRVFRQITEPRS